jgi:HAD superfamily hydrolase (TIGR01509 family)
MNATTGNKGKLMKIRAVVFDLDGTIAAFNLDYMTLRSEVRSHLLKVGVPASLLFVNESIFDMLNKAEVFLRNSGKSMRSIEKLRGEALAIAEKYELEAAKNTSLLPNVTETLKALRKMDMKLGLCTVNSEKSANYILKRFGIADYFDAVVPRNKVKHVKPSGEHLDAVLKALDVKPQETLLIGDSARDMACAQELKIMAIGLSTGVSTQKELADAGANYLIMSLADMPNLLKTVGKIAKKSAKEKTFS